MRKSRGKRSQRISLTTLERLYGGNNNKYDFDDRYGDNWKKTCSLTHRATNGVCVCCMQAPSKVVHHMMYSDSLGAVKNRELPGVHVIPVCEACHMPICHAPKNWIKSRSNPRLLNRNTAAFTRKMMQQFNKLQRDYYNATKHIC